MQNSQVARQTTTTLQREIVPLPLKNKNKKIASFLNTYKALFPDVLGCCVYFLKCFQKYGYILRKW